jgi:hypothetical protein
VEHVGGHDALEVLERQVHVDQLEGGAEARHLAAVPDMHGDLRLHGRSRGPLERV